MDVDGSESSWMDMLQYILPIIIIIGGYLWYNQAPAKPAPKPIPVVKKVVEKKKAPKLEGRPLKLFYGSQTGTAEDFAHKISAEAKKFGFAPEVIDLEEYEKETLNEEKFVMFLMATYGEGEPTDNAREFYEWLMSPDREVGSLTGVQFSVFGLGNKTYEHYNSMGRKTNEQLEKLGAQRIYQYGEGDDDASLEDDFAAWKKDLWPTVCKHFGMEIDMNLLNSAAERRFKMNTFEPGTKQHEQAQAIASRHLCKKGDTAAEKAISTATVKINRELHTQQSDRSCRHLEIQLAPGVTYTAGDHLAIYPENHPDMVEALGKRLGINLNQVFSLVAEKDGRTFLGPTTFRQVLSQWCDITSPPRKSLLKILAGYTTDEDEKKRLLELSDDSKSEPYGSYVKDSQRTLLEILEEFQNVKIPIDHLIEVLPRLACRYYSISSSLKAHPGHVHVTSVVVEFETPTKRKHKGVCSSWLAQLEAESQIYVFVRDSGFRLPKDPKTPVIMVGPGTGLAPFRGFIQDRSKTEGSGEMVLFFGCRNPEIDFIYRDELLEAEKTSHLKLFTAFSRATENKVYVHHKMLENGDLIWKLLKEENAYFYVCGDARQMAKDVKNALVKIGESKGESVENSEKFVEDLIKNQRYQTDVWF